MALSDITVEEKFRGRSGTTGKDASWDVEFVARSKNKVEDDLDVKKAVLLASASVWQDVDGSYMDRIGVSRFDEQGGGLWHVTVSYAKNAFGPLDPGQGRYTFRTSGGSQHILYSKGTEAKYGAFKGVGVTPGVAPDHHNAIGVTGHGAIEGCDIVVPVYEFSETHLVPSSNVGDAYKRTLFTLTGKSNGQSYKGLDPGECLFLGAEGERQGRTGDWEISYSHAGSPNVFVKVQGIAWPGPEGIEKRGWNYLWVQYEDFDDTDAKSLAKKPIGAYEERVYDDGRFADLGIGTA